jgi:replicative DNA helicase
MTGDVRLRFKNEFAKFINVDEDVPVQEFVSGTGLKSGFVPEPISPSTEDFISTNNSHSGYPF